MSLLYFDQRNCRAQAAYREVVRSANAVGIGPAPRFPYTIIARNVRNRVEPVRFSSREWVDPRKRVSVPAQLHARSSTLLADFSVP